MHGDHVTGEELLEVADVRLQRRHAAVLGAQVARRQADPVEQVPHGLVELGHVVLDVHVVHVVQVLRIDRAPVGQEQLVRSRFGVHRRLLPARARAVE